MLLVHLLLKSDLSTWRRRSPSTNLHSPTHSLRASVEKFNFPSICGIIFPGIIQLAQLRAILTSETMPRLCTYPLLFKRWRKGSSSKIIMVEMKRVSSLEGMNGGVSPGNSDD